jgi:hypothetical protein
MKRNLFTIGAFIVLSIANIASAAAFNVDGTIHPATLKQSVLVQYSADNDNTTDSSDNDKSCCKKKKTDIS